VCESLSSAKYLFMPVTEYDRVCESLGSAVLFSPTLGATDRVSPCPSPRAPSFDACESAALYIVPCHQGLGVPSRHGLGWPELAGRLSLASVSSRTWHWTRGVDVTGSLLNYQPALFSSHNWDGVTFSPTAPSSPMPAHPFAAIITPALVSGIEDWRNGSQVCFGMGLGWLGLQRAG
jgi:hypothetical protein